MLAKLMRPEKVENQDSNPRPLDLFHCIVLLLSHAHCTGENQAEHRGWHGGQQRDRALSSGTETGNSELQVSFKSSCYVASVVSDSLQPHRWQSTRLPCPWDSPGKNTGVGCHFLLQCMKVKSEREVTESCPTLSDPMDCGPPGSSIHGIFQARVLEWGAI